MPAKLDGLNEKELDKNYWPIATLAEAYFGLGNYEEAGQWLSRIKKIPAVPEWQIVSTAKQLVQLTQYQAKPGLSNQELEQTQAWKTLLEFIGRKAYALRSMFRGKIGLALSGGGFRASLYHIGVLAKLAEYDLLRHIEVLSCVSGGSIIGAHYYLELRRLINTENKSDESISRDDYIKADRNDSRRLSCRRSAKSQGTFAGQSLDQSEIDIFIGLFPHPTLGRTL